MTSDARGKFLSKFIAVLLVGLAFVASAAMMAQDQGSLFVDLPDAAQETAQVD